MAALFNSPKAPPMMQPAPVMPKSGSEEVRKAGDDRLRVMAGRASNYLTNPSAAERPVDAKRTLGSL